MKEIFAEEKKILKELSKNVPKEEPEETVDVVNNSEDSNLQLLDSLPILQLSDISSEIERVEYARKIMINGIPVKYISQPTNGITYLRIKFDILDIPLHLRQLFPLYAEIAPLLGTLKHSHQLFSDQKDLNFVSNLFLDTFVSSNIISIDSHSEQMVLEMGFIDRNLHNAFDLLTEFLTQIDFKDYERTTSVIQKSAKRRADSLNRNGLIYAISLAESSITSAANSFEKLSVLNHDCYLATLLQNSLSMKKVIDDVIDRFEEIHKFLMQKQRMSILVHTSDLNNATEIDDRLELLINGLSIEFDTFSKNRPNYEIEKFEPFLYQAYLTVPGPLNHVIESYMGVPLMDKSYPSLLVLSELMTHKILRHELCEKSSALDAGCKVDARTGTISFYSNRDPENLKTFNTFEKSMQRVSSENFDEKYIQQAKLSTFSKVDAPIPPHQKGLAMFLNDITNEMRQKMRKDILNVSKEDILRANEDFLIKPLEKGLSSRVVIGNEKIEKTILTEAGWKIHRPLKLVSDNQ